MTEAPRFRPEEILRVLQDFDVEFVVIGGLASQAHGSPSLTGDVDICYERSPGNLARLSAALTERLTNWWFQLALLTVGRTALTPPGVTSAASVF